MITLFEDRGDCLYIAEDEGEARIVPKSSEEAVLLIEEYNNQKESMQENTQEDVNVDAIPEVPEVPTDPETLPDETNEGQSEAIVPEEASEEEAPADEEVPAEEETIEPSAPQGEDAPSEEETA